MNYYDKLSIKEECILFHNYMDLTEAGMGMASHLWHTSLAHAFKPEPIADMSSIEMMANAGDKYKHTMALLKIQKQELEGCLKDVKKAIKRLKNL